MGGFFDGVDVVFVTLAPSATAPGVPAEVPSLSTEPVPIDEGTHTGKVSGATPVPAETHSPQNVVTSPATVQIEAASLATPLVIFTSDPFVALSQAAKDGSSLVVTPSSIPNSTTRGSDVDLSSEGSEDVLEDLDDEPVLNKMISDSNNEEDVPPRSNSWVCVFLPFYFLFLAKSIPPPFLSSLP